MLSGDTNPTFERALRTHLRYGKVQGHGAFVMRTQAPDTLYKKLVMNEMKKTISRKTGVAIIWTLIINVDDPDNYRWFDYDSFLLNPKFGLSHFLPPAEFQHANVLVTKDGNGLNNGVFFIWVCAWAVEVMSANLAHRIFTLTSN